jgi:hypothetical protein
VFQCNIEAWRLDGIFAVTCKGNWIEVWVSDKELDKKPFQLILKVLKGNWAAEGIQRDGKTIAGKDDIDQADPRHAAHLTVQHPQKDTKRYNSHR